MALESADTGLLAAPTISGERRLVGKVVIEGLFDIIDDGGLEFNCCCELPKS